MLLILNQNNQQARAELCQMKQGTAVDTKVCKYLLMRLQNWLNVVLPQCTGSTRSEGRMNGPA
ncbi:hypothetical protein [Pseudomonas orientalis]|uniref:hypothetical protein n=1 Tax=Pseudomonas orientalis TaxID=76758 RepID=UPI000F579B76|nr:hypothetical protein [Pseudomonas orientalis]